MLTEDIKRHTSYTFAMYPMGEYKEIKMDVGHFACVFDTSLTSTQPQRQNAFMSA